MPKKTPSQMRTETRDNFMKELMELIQTYKGDDTLPYKGNAFSVPQVLENGDETYVQVTVSIPTGTRDGTQFNGYEEHEDFLKRQEEKRIAAEERAAEKAKQTAEKKAKQEAAKKKREEAEAERQRILARAQAEADAIIADAKKTRCDYDSAIEAVLKEFRQRHSDNG